MELHVISSGSMPLSEFTAIAIQIHSYVDAIHLRERHCTAVELYGAIAWMLEKGTPAKKLVINDRVDVALAARIGGIHLAHHSLPTPHVKRLSPEYRIGRSVHSVEEAIRSEEEGADYLFYGHVFASYSKPGRSPRGLVSLQEVADSVSIPVIAIGGIGPDQVHDVMDHGARGIAVISGILHAPDPLAAARQYKSKLNERRSGYGANS
ncbi:thiamine phosphate synthase [Paenibacillus guangzhouensis]|uniref:thiamine phosphate synthase n=1 Tax=Paenibacillus guangzhouensis TaxID=1473112 RepID=UPI001266B407|nr:thiamine phosphate synthase [Paenibacillus guangzhouensis]